MQLKTYFGLCGIGWPLASLPTPISFPQDVENLEVKTGGGRHTDCSDDAVCLNSVKVNI